MTKAESAASRTPRTDALHRRLVKISEGPNWIAGKDYVDMTDHARALELEAAALRERLAKAETDARHVRQANENYRRENQIAVKQLTKAREEAYELGWIAAAKWADEEHLIADIDSPAYLEDRNRALTQKGADHSGKIEKQHQWSDDGERCIKCGDKDWMGGPCNG